MMTWLNQRAAAGLVLCMAISSVAFAQTSEPNATAPNSEESGGNGPEVVGVRLGMTAAEATAILKRRPVSQGERRPYAGYIVLVADAPGVNGRIAVPNGKYLSLLANGETGRNATTTDHDDRFNVSFTPVPGNERVAAIYRRVGFPLGAKPLKENLVNDLIKKYGKPTQIQARASTYIWAFDTHGNLMTGWLGNQCNVEFPEPSAYVTDPTSPEFRWTNNLAQGWKSKLDFFQSCGSRVLRVELQGPTDLPVVDSLRLSYSDVQAVIAGQRVAAGLTAAARKNTAETAVRSANQVKTPDL